MPLHNIAYRRKYFLFFTLLFASISSFAQSGECLRFNGINNNVLLPYGLNGSYTKEAWIKPAVLSGFPNIISGNNTALFITNGKLTAGHAGANAYADVQDTANLTINTWYHIAVSYNAGTSEMKLYKNGVEVASNASASSYTEGVLYLSYFNAGNYFMGDMDEVRIWNTVRTLTEINQTKNCELNGDETGLLAYYNFNQGTAAGSNTAITMLTDSQDKCIPLNGSLNNFTLIGSSSNFIAPGASVSGTCSNTFPNINITGNSNCIAIGDNTPSGTDHTNFGNFSTTPIIKTYTIHNTGNAILTINNTSLAGLNAADFSIYSYPPASIAAGASANFSVSFNPSGVLGNKTAIVSVNSNDADEAIYSFTIGGIKSDVGRSLDFDGLNDDVTVPFVFTGDYTKEAWIKTNTHIGFPNIFSGDGTALFLNNGKLAAGHAPSFNQAVDVTVLDTNQWYHVAVSYNASSQQMKLYLNGNPVLTVASVPAYVESNLKIGSYNGANFFWGRIDQIRAWNVVRTDAEILNSASCNLTGHEPGLTLLYNFNVGAGEGDNSGLLIVPNEVDECNAATKNASLNNFALNGAISNFVSESANITGNCLGTFPNIAVQGNGICIVSGDTIPNVADNTDFGNISGATNKTFSIQNTGTSVLNIGSINFTGTNSAMFSVTSAPPATIAPGSSANFVVTINPVGSGLKTATITINNNDADEATFNFKLQAFVQSGVFVISNITVTPNINGTASITWNTNVPTNSLVDYGTNAGTLNLNESNAAFVTNHSLQLTGLSLGTTYYYRVTSTDAANNTVTVPTPPAAPFSFNMPPLITTHPVSQTICEANQVTFTSAANSDVASTVQWQISTDNGLTWTNSLGATDSILSFNVSNGDNGKQFRAVWTNAGGANNSTAATLTVKDTTWSVTNVELCNNLLPYNWNGVNYTSAGTYTVVLSGANANGCDSTAVLNLTVINISATVSKQYVSCIGLSDGALTVAAIGTATPYQYSNNNGATWNFTGNFTGLAAGNHTIRIKDANGCFNDTTLTLDIDKAYWTGAINNNWHTAGNWSTGQVPTSSTHVIIPNGTVVAIISNNNAEAASVQVFTGAQLQTQNNKELLVAGKCTTLPFN
ncbi:MAG TPA: choice-of-anchor D domain-containing protein [Ferruginibacter sp.]|nr:choice-of-anchor D domain-containing protein [Ferruginibacter sp.]HRE64165.1 choice-of-anchor D domain-containing protein [Ferruginibacter sp.]